VAVKRLWVVVLVALLASCGFHLRGKMELPEAMQNIYLENASAPLVTEVTKMLKFSNGKIVKDKQEAGLIVKVSDEVFRRVSLSLSHTGKTNEFELYYSVDFEMLDAAGKILLPKKNMVITRSYFNDQTQVLAKGNEEDFIRQEIYRYAGREMVERARGALTSVAN
jgi:LPS-assembly lipoprotein